MKITFRRNFKTVLWLVGFVSFGAQAQSIPPFQAATLLDVVDSERSVVYDFITGPADKIKRDVIIENSVRVNGRVVKSTYAMPSDVRREEVFDYYQDQLQRMEAQTIFSCEGPDCGRSTTWASEIFKRRDLSAPIRNQTYSASVVSSADSQSLFAIYVVARGNLRVMAHVEEIQVTEPITFDTNQSFEDELIRRGVVMLKGVKPSVSGALSTNDLDEAVSLLESIRLLPTHEIYVVCHIHASTSTHSLIDASQKCANSLATRIAAETEFSTHGFGVGPLMPVDDRPLTRIELVVPALLRTE